MTNNILDADILDGKEETQQWRQELHAHPQTSYEEEFASQFIQKKLSEMGIEFEAGIAKTGVVGILPGKPSNKAIALRADIDALDITEENNVSYRSIYPGKMHACGHDGHTAMLLAAAKILKKRQSFAGTVYLLFQPAEEGGAGGAKMIEDGLFEKYAIDTVWGMHNSPGLPVGHWEVKPGPMLGSADEFHVTIKGHGGHAAMPQTTIDPLLIACHLVGSLQSIVSRNLAPTDAAVVSITRINAGTAFNIIPDEVKVEGTFRTLSSPVRELVVQRIKTIAQGIATAFGAKAEVHFMPNNYPVLVNSEKETAIAVEVAKKTYPIEHINPNMVPVLGAEDFSFMLEKKPGCYVFIGNGAAGKKGSNGLHTSRYDFNDDAAPYGVQYWVNLTEHLLAPA